MVEEEETCSDDVRSFYQTNITTPAEDVENKRKLEREEAARKEKEKRNSAK